MFLFTWGDGRMTYEGEHIPVRVETMAVPQIQGALLLPSVLEHTIDERSPLHHLTHDDLVARNAEIVVIFEAVSDFGDTFMVRRSYLPSEVHWGSFFVPVTQKAGPGSLRHVVDLSRFHDVMPMEGMEHNLPPSEQSRAVLAGGSPLQPRTLPYPALGENTLVVSDRCVAMARDKARCLAVRVGDTRPGQMLEVRVRAYLYEWAARTTKEGEVLPYTMKVRPRVALPAQPSMYWACASHRFCCSLRQTARHCDCMAVLEGNAAAPVTSSTLCSEHGATWCSR